MKRAEFLTRVITHVFTVLMLSACGDETERSAAAVEDNTQESSDPLSDANVGAFFGSGTNVCVKNSSSKTLPVTMKKADTSTGDNPLTPGGKLCIEGTYGGGQDVVFFLNLGDGNYDMSINATNQSIGQPRFYLTQLLANPASRADLVSCIYQGFASMEENATNDGVLEYTVRRLPDTNWKEFELTLRDDPNPSSTGKTKLCDRVGPR